MDRELIAAIESLDLAKVKELLTAGANPNARKGDQTAYQIASQSRKAKEIECELIEAGADDSSMVRALGWLTTTGRIKTVKALIEKGVDINANSYRGTPIQDAAYEGYIEIVELLIKAGADVDASGGLSTPLLDALEQAHNEIALKLITAGANPNTLSTFGGTLPIAMAAICSSGEVIKALVSAGADINAITKQITLNQKIIRQQTGVALTSAFNLLETAGKAIEKLDNEDNPNVSETVESFELAAQKTKLTSAEIPKSQNAFDSTPLILAVRSGNISTLQALLELGADPHCKDGEGLSAYEWAVKNELPQVLTVLQQAGINKVVVTPEERLLNAAEQGDTALVQELIEQGVDVNCRDSRKNTKNSTPLMLAATGGYLESVEMLLSANADPNLNDSGEQEISEGIKSLGFETILSMGYKIGQTALIAAANKGYQEILQKLITAEAAINYQDKLGRTALFVACEAENLEIVQILLDAGANVDLKTTNGESTLLAPTRRCDLPLIELLIANGIGLDAISEALVVAAGATQEVKVKKSDPPQGDREYTEKGVFETRPLPEEKVLEIVKLLIDQGADINIKESYHTPINAAATQGYIKVMQYLLDLGANPEIKDAVGYDALYLADLFDRKEALELLKQHTGNLDWNRKNYYKKELDYEEKDRWGKEVPEPDFSEAAKNLEYQQAVQDLGELCGSKPVLLHDIPGWFQIHVNTQKSSEIDTEKIQQQFLERGCFVYEPDYYFGRGMRKLCILPTTDKYDAVALHHTNGCNYDVGTGYIIEWLQNLEQEQPFILTCIANDTLSGRFLNPVQDSQKLAEEMYDICPDIVDQGCESVERLVEELTKKQSLYFWWD